MKKTTLEFQQIGASGAGMIIGTARLTTSDLQQIVSSAKGLVNIKGASNISTLDCEQIAASAQGRVIFDFTS